MAKLPCSVCGTLILETTAKRLDGKCVPCSSGTRANMEASRRRYAEERERRKTDPATLYWTALVQRVHGTEGGFDTLSEQEKRYFAVGCLDGEVYNGGFHQFFSNSSGAYYRHAVAGLEELGASRALDLLLRAKQVLFDFADVPEKTTERWALLRKNDDPSRQRRADALDDAYYEDPDSLGERLAEYAREHGLY